MQNQAITIRRSALPFVVMAKPAGPACNLACEYCYYRPTAAYQQTTSWHMGQETLEALVTNYFASCPGPYYHFIWHGGEPTLAGLDFFREAVRLQKKHLPPGAECWNNLQTNGILLDGPFCDFLAGEHFDVGLSMDGNRAVHDFYRKDHAGAGSWDRVAASLRRLIDRGVSVDLLCTVNGESEKSPEAVYSALRAFGTGWIQFIPVVRRDLSGSVTADSVTPHGYARFLKGVFNEWISGDFAKLHVQQFAEMLLVINGMPSNLCWMSMDCGRVLVVEHDGTVFSCDHFVSPEHRIGSLTEDALSDLVDGPVQTAFGQRKTSGLSGACLECNWLKYCNGACPKDRFAAGEDGQTQNYLCKGLKSFFAFAEAPLAAYSAYASSEGKASASAAAAGIAKVREGMFAGVKPTDPCPCGSMLPARNCCWEFRRSRQGKKGNG